MGVNAATEDDIDDELLAEQKEHGDLILLRHEEQYKQLFRKTAALFHWGSNICSAMYTLKADDDSFLWIEHVRHSQQLFASPVSRLWMLYNTGCL